MSNLLELSQPKDYKSKLKLFCREKEFKIENFIEKFAQVKNNNYICREKQIKIEEL